MSNPHLKKATLFGTESLVLESGEALKGGVTVAYETFGRLNDARDNAVLICHALTGDTHVAAHDEGDTPGWWEAFVGPGKMLDTDRLFLVCSNILGSCYGTTGPNTVKNGNGELWGGSFPYPTMADVVRVQRELLHSLGIERLALVIGGSLGGQQTLQWAVDYPDMVQSAVAIACDERASAWVIALQDVGRQAIQNALQYPTRPELLDQALATARMLAMISYRTPQIFRREFDRSEVDVGRRLGENLRYEVESYLRYQGAKLVRRFEAQSYLRLTRMLDGFDVGRAYGSVDDGLARIDCPVCLVGIDTDVLFDCNGPRRLAGRLRNLGKDAEFRLLASEYGHDAFLIEAEALAELVGPFLARSVRC